MWNMQKKVIFPVLRQEVSMNTQYYCLLISDIIEIFLLSAVSTSETSALRAMSIQWMMKQYRHGGRT